MPLCDSSEQDTCTSEAAALRFSTISLLATTAENSFSVSKTQMLSGKCPTPPVHSQLWRVAMLADVCQRVLEDDFAQVCFEIRNGY